MQESGYDSTLFDRIISWEKSQLSEPDMLSLFAELVTCGLAWKSTGQVRRTAALLIRDGRINRIDSKRSARKIEDQGLTGQGTKRRVSTGTGEAITALKKLLV